MAFDVGDKRIGVAISDPFNDYAMPVDTYWRTRDFQTDVKNLAAMATERDVGEIVCGLPVHADGTASVQTEKTERFIAALKECVTVPVVTEDERFTSIQAHETLHEEGFKVKKHKKNVDSVAASYILDSYLARKKRKINKEKEEL